LGFTVGGSCLCLFFQTFWRRLERSPGARGPGRGRYQAASRSSAAPARGKLLLAARPHRWPLGSRVAGLAPHSSGLSNNFPLEGCWAEPGGARPGSPALGLLRGAVRVSGALGGTTGQRGAERRFLARERKPACWGRRVRCHRTLPFRLDGLKDIVGVWA
jgi:hypothetical protein